jgi:hypothetical protein
MQAWNEPGRAGPSLPFWGSACSGDEQVSLRAGAPQPVALHPSSSDARGSRSLTVRAEPLARQRRVAADEASHRAVEVEGMVDIAAGVRVAGAATRTWLLCLAQRENRNNPKTKSSLLWVGKPSKALDGGSYDGACPPSLPGTEEPRDGKW